MAKKTRNKIKQQLEGMHNNFTWLKWHIDQVLNLIGCNQTEMRDALKSLSNEDEQLDKFVQDMYARV